MLSVSGRELPVPSSASTTTRALRRHLTKRRQILGDRTGDAAAYLQALLFPDVDR